MAKCKLNNCPEIGYPWFSGCCSKRHQSAYMRSTAQWNSKPNTPFTVLGKPAVNRFHGTDRKKVSGAE